MKVTVDMNKCQDHGQCCFAAPEVFQLSAEGHLVYVADPDEAQRSLVEDAADVCPVQAILIEG